MTFKNAIYSRFRAHLNQKIFQLAFPVFLGMTSFTIIQISDTFMVGKLGEYAIAAAGMGGIAYFTVLAFLMNGSVGIQILTSRRYGEKNPKAIGEILFSVLIAGIFVSALITWLGSLFSPYLISRMTPDLKLREEATVYLQARFWGTLGYLMLYTLRGYFDGLGKPIIGMYSAILTMVSNIFFNWIFIYGNLGVPAMGVKGAGIASSLAGGVGFLVFFLFLFGKETRNYLRLSQYRLRWEILKTTFRIGFPSAMDGSLTNIAFLIFNKMAADIGVESVAASQIVFSVLTLSFMPGFAFSVAATTIFGHAIGSGKFKKAILATYRSAFFSAILMGMMGILFIIFGKEIISQFSEGDKLIHEAYPALVVVSLVQVGDAYHMVFGAALKSAGLVVWVLLSYVIVSYGIMLPLAYWLGIELGLGTMGLWSSISLWLLILSLLFLWKFRKGDWKSIQL